MKIKVNEKISRAFGKAMLVIKNNAPQILVGTGIITGGATVYFACKGTVKTLPALAEASEKITEAEEKLDRANESGCDCDPEVVKNAKSESYAMVGKEIVKNFAPAAAFGAISVTCILVGTHILHKRNLAYAAAYATLNESFTAYRNNIVKTFGEQADQDALHSVYTEYETDPESGEVINEKVRITGSGYGRFFDEVCGANDWSRDPNYNYLFLRARQNDANVRLKTQGYLFLNDVYDMLGIERTLDGNLVGWIYEDPAKDFIQFDVMSHVGGKNRMVNVADDMPDDITDGMYVDFNVQGPVIDRLRGSKFIRER